MKWSELDYVDKINHHARACWGQKPEDFLIEFDLSFKGLPDLNEFEDKLNGALENFEADLDIHVERISKNFPYKEADLSFEVTGLSSVKEVLYIDTPNFCPLIQGNIREEFILTIKNTFKEAIENWERYE